MILNLPLTGANGQVAWHVNVSVQNGRAETMYAIALDRSGRYTKEEVEEAAKKAHAYNEDFFRKAFREGEPLWQAYNHTVEWFDSLSAEDQAFFRQRGWNRDAYVARVDYWRAHEAGVAAGAVSAHPDAHLKDPKWQSVMKMFREMEANFSAWMKDQSRRWDPLQPSRLERQDVVDLSPEAMQHLQETVAEAEAVKA